MPKVELRNISKRYGDVRAVDCVNQTISDGEFCVIVGPSGSGKTTLLNIIAGITMPDEGDVFVDGKNFNLLPPRERNIGMVFQDIGLFTHMTARKNISFGLEIQKKKKRDIDDRVNDIANRLKIMKLLDKKPGVLSGGEAQRVAIARTLITDPTFFLFDEPLGNLDADLRLEMLTEIKQLHLLLKKTFIYVTHDQKQALSAGNRVIIMKDGQVLQEGHPRKVYSNPSSRFVADFFGMPSMNLIDGIVVPEGEGSVFTGSGIRLNLKEYKTTRELEATLGVRPNDVKVDIGIGEHGYGFINSIEYLGDKNHIYLTLEHDIQLVAITSPQVVPELEKRVGLVFDEQKVFLFDKTKGGRLYP